MIPSCPYVSGVAVFVYGNLVNWFSHRQKCIANSTCQAEILSIVEATLESEYVLNLLSEIQVTLKFLLRNRIKVPIEQ